MWGWGVTLKGLKKVKCLSQGVRTVCLCVPGWICPLVFVGLESRTAWGCCLSARLIGKYSSFFPIRYKKGYTCGKDIDFYLTMVVWQEIIDYNSASGWAVDSTRLWVRF